MRALLFLSIASIVFVSSCQTSGGGEGSSGLPRASVAPGTLVIVAESELYNSTAGEALQDVFAAAIYGLPQLEPEFDIQHFSPDKFSSLMRLSPNILVVEQSDTKPIGFELKRDVYARQQVVAFLRYKTSDDLLETLQNDGPRVIDALNKVEHERIATKFASVPEKSVIEEVETQYGIKLALPKDFRLALSRPSFAWMRLEKSRPSGTSVHPINQGIMIWYTPYTDTSQFNIEALMATRDSITQRYIPGPTDGSYMNISHRAYEPVIKSINWQDRYTVEMRGLWRVENGFMGGPFVSITTLDTKNSRMITIDGYVFAPEFDKREYLREVEAIIKSAKFTNS